jgi:glycosyltransferase involved in cell wall biosynthesis
MDEDHYIAVPSEETVLELEQIEKDSSRPSESFHDSSGRSSRFLLTRRLRKCSTCCEMTATRGIRCMRKKDLLGLLTSNGIARWAAGNVKQDRLEIDLNTVKLADVLMEDHRKDRVAFVSRDAFIDDVDDLFTREKQLEAVLITPSGKPHEKPIGMICAPDVASRSKLLTPSEPPTQQADEVHWIALSPQRPDDVAKASDEPADAAGDRDVEPEREITGSGKHVSAAQHGTGSFEHIRFIEVPAEFSHPYQRAADEGPVGDDAAHDSHERGNENSGGEGDDVETRDQQFAKPQPPKTSIEQAMHQTIGHSAQHKGDVPISRAPQELQKPQAAFDYDGDMMGNVEQYAKFCLVATHDLDFDVIHAHDWMTYPAGLLIARVTGKPLVVHIHSTEFDRSGEQVNQQIYDIERRGMHGAMRVIAVSQLTKNVVVSRYGLPDWKVEVVYNGVDLEPSEVGITGIRSKDKIVLYFGRITYQKGPEYFIQAAKRVLEVMPDVKFVVAGSGDQAKRMIEMAAELGIGHKVLFTGFLRGNDIKRVFNLADLYVMPSVSEPFGIAPLEAMSHNVPVLISKTSGVSEVLTHALKVDFWDIDDMANKIIAVLKYPPLHRTLQEHGAFEVRRLTWDGAAERCEQIYHAVQSEMTGHGARHS